MCCLRGLHGPEHMVSTATLLLGLVHPRPSGHRGSPAHRARVSPGAPHFWAPVYPEQPGPQQVGQSTWPPLAHPPSTCLQLQAVYSELDQAKLELRSAQKDLQVADKEIAVRGTPGGNGVVCVPLRAELGWLCPEPAQSVELALGSLTLPRPVGRDVHLGLVWSLADGTRVFPQSLFGTDSPRAPEKELCQGGVWARGGAAGPALLGLPSACPSRPWQSVWT